MNGSVCNNFLKQPRGTWPWMKWLLWDYWTSSVAALISITLMWKMSTTITVFLFDLCQLRAEELNITFKCTLKHTHTHALSNGTFQSGTSTWYYVGNVAETMCVLNKGSSPRRTEQTFENLLTVCVCLLLCYNLIQSELIDVSTRGKRSDLATVANFQPQRKE